MVPQLIKIFLALYGSQTFITLFTTARNWSLFLAAIASSKTSHPTQSRFISILSVHQRLVLPSVSFFQVSPQKPFKHFPSPYDPPVSSSWFWHTNDTARVHLRSSFLCNFIHSQLLPFLIAQRQKAWCGMQHSRSSEPIRRDMGGFLLQMDTLFNFCCTIHLFQLSHTPNLSPVPVQMDTLYNFFCTTNLFQLSHT
jgi:hypothetical protein